MNRYYVFAVRMSREEWKSLLWENRACLRLFSWLFPYVLWIDITD